MDGDTEEKWPLPSSVWSQFSAFSIVQRSGEIDRTTAEQRAEGREGRGDVPELKT